MNTPHVHPASGISPPSYHPVRPFLSESLSHLSLRQPVLSSETVWEMPDEHHRRVRGNCRLLPSVTPARIPAVEPLPQVGVGGQRTEPGAARVGAGNFSKRSITVTVPTRPTGVVKLFRHGAEWYTASQNWASQTSDDVSMLTARGREVGHNYSSDYNYDDLWTKSWKRVL